jgi:hypothetical protein
MQADSAQNTEEPEQAVEEEEVIIITDSEESAGGEGAETQRKRRRCGERDADSRRDTSPPPASAPAYEHAGAHVRTPLRPRRAPVAPLTRGSASATAGRSLLLRRSLCGRSRWRLRGRLLCRVASWRRSRARLVRARSASCWFWSAASVLPSAASRVRRTATRARARARG